MTASAPDKFVSIAAAAVALSESQAEIRQAMYRITALDLYVRSELTDPDAKAQVSILTDLILDNLRKAQL